MHILKPLLSLIILAHAIVLRLCIATAVVELSFLVLRRFVFTLICDNFVYVFMCIFVCV
jgi:hypothetical protein